MNKIAKLENRKLELIRNIQLCQNSKRRVIGFVEELDRQYALKEIDLEIYKQKLNNVLKQRTLEQWTNYYNGCITYYRHGLELCDKELRRQENKTKALQLTTIAGVLAVFILSFMFVNPEFTGFSIYQPGNIINESVHFKIDQFVPNSSILEINFNEEKYFSNISKYLAELTSIDKDNNTIYGYNVSELKVKTVHAYNIGKKFHPKQNNWVGYVIALSTGERVYHSGDTDLTPEMRGVVTEFALLPCGGTYTMSGKEAGDAANIFKPRAVIPMHWGDIVGTRADAEEVQKVFKGETIIKAPEKG